MVVSTAQTYGLAEENDVCVRDYIMVVATAFGMYFFLIQELFEGQEN